jgi:hypothetical protein
MWLFLIVLGLELRQGNYSVGLSVEKESLTAEISASSIPKISAFGANIENNSGEYGKNVFRHSKVHGGGKVYHKRYGRQA